MLTIGFDLVIVARCCETAPQRANDDCTVVSVWINRSRSVSSLVMNEWDSYLGSFLEQQDSPPHLIHIVKHGPSVVAMLDKESSFLYSYYTQESQNIDTKNILSKQNVISDNILYSELLISWMHIFSRITYINCLFFLLLCIILIIGSRCYKKSSFPGCSYL